MSKKASTTAIGAFVLGAIALIVAGVVVFGSGKFLKKTQKVVMFFDGSVKGLQVGAPVVIRGVAVGQVTDLALEFDAERMTALIPVYAEIEPAKIKRVGSGGGGSDHYRELIETGLRAQLQTQSLVTGMLLVDLDFRPQSPARLVGIDKGVPEIPTVPSDLQLLSKKLEELPIEEIASRLASTLEGLERLVHSPRLEANLASLDTLLVDLDKLARSANVQLAGLTSGANRLVANVDAQAQLVAASLVKTSEATRETLARATLALDEAQKAVVDVRQVAAQNADVGYQLSESIEQMTALSRSLRTLTDYLARHPEALVRGKAGP